MAVVLEKLEGRAILTLNNHPSMRALFAQFDMECVDIQYIVGGPSNTASRTELIIYGSFKNAVGNAAHEACGLKAEKSSLPAMRNSTVRMVLKLAYPRALRLAA